MKLHFTYEWLKNRIENDLVGECDAGLPLRDSAPLQRFVDPQTEETPESAPEKKTRVLSILVRQVRRRDGLTIDALGERLRVEASELKKLEADPAFTPSPRTLHKLALYMKVPTTSLQRLTPDTVDNDEEINEAALRFAASSDDLSQLTPDERSNLNDFVKALANHKDEAK